MATESKFQALARRMRVFPPGIWVAALAVCLVGGRYLWIWAQRPGNEREIAAAYGPASLFHGAPQSDSTGRHITFVKTADVGFGVFLCDTATGQKRNVRVPTGERDLDYPFFRVWPLLKVWPWSPDDSSFAYSDNEWLFICDGQTGQSTARFDLPSPVTALTWLNPASIRFMEGDGKLHQLDRQENGTWRSQAVAIGEFELRSLKNCVDVVASQAAAWEDAANAVDGDPTTSWFSGKTNLPVWLQCQFSGLAWAITRYTLTSSSTDAEADPRDWQLLGSDDGTNWTVLDARSNETFTAREQAKHYDFANETPYWFYRLNVTATAGGAGSGARLAEFQLYSRDAPAIASASSEGNSTAESASVAFDGSVNTKWFNNYENPPVWLQYQLGGSAGAVLAKYSLTSGSDVPSRDPGAWEFQASNDGVKWTTLDTRAGESFDSRLQTKFYSFKNVTPYRFYRLYITQSHGMDQNGMGGVQLAELNLGLKELLAKIGNPDGGLALRNTGVVALASSADAAHGAGVNNVHDQDKSTSWYSGKTNGTVWLQYEFNDGAWAITQYKLINVGTNSATDPRDWQLLASNDGANWIVLDRQTNQAFTSRRQSKRYPISNPAPYQFYRLNFTANVGGNNNGIRLAEFQLWSDDTPSVATANAENAPNEGAAQAFDGDTNTKWYNANGGTTGWLQYKFGGGEARTLSSYALTSGNDVPGRDPKEWQFQASNDGQTWMNLDTESGQTFESRHQTKSYRFANNTDYCYYRLNILTNGGDAGLQLSELDLGVAAHGGLAPSLNAGGSSGGQSGKVGLGLNPFANTFSLTTVDDRTIAWGQSKWIWSLSLDSNAPQPLLDVQTVMPPNTTLRSFNYAHGRFLLTCDTAGTPSVWSLDPNNAPSVPVKIADGVSDAVWISGGGWVARQNNYLLVRHEAASEPVRIVPRAAIDGFAVSPDGHQLFIQGTIKDEMLPGMWQYDLAASKLICVTPYSDKPLADARHENYSGASLRLPSGETINYDIFPPDDAYKHPHRKRPLVMGDTIVVGDVRGARSRNWVQALNAGGAYVVIVTRPSWWPGINQWSANVRAAYNEVVKTLPIDRSRVFLFGISAEAGNMDDLITQSPGLWRGVIYINPNGQLPDFSHSSLFEQRPRIYISAGSLEGEDEMFKQYQEKTLQSGAMVEYVSAPGETHNFIGNAAHLQRTKDIMRLIFDE